MIKVKNISVMNLENALRGMRNPLESWNQSDSFTWKGEEFTIGEKDLNLALKLIKAGSDHSKFIRQILVSMDITAPMTWWWDFDTYKVSTVKNSTSRMHKLGSRLLTPDDFSWDNTKGEIVITELRKYTLNELNNKISKWQKIKNDETQKEYTQDLWREIVFDLPDSYNFLSTWTGNYENLRNVYHARKNHKQREFKDFCKTIEELPYSILITTERIS